jgi:4a-hydroxytetrahydrobiopterin dehydratase
MSEEHPTKLSGEEVTRRQVELGRGWQVIDNHHLEKNYAFKNFREALDFTMKIGEIAEAVNHHPDIFLAWGKVRVTIFSHSVDGLTKYDFDLAAKFES